jgi:hypothetical protein
VSVVAGNVRGMETQSLIDVELAMLEFERQRWKYVGAKETAILDQFGMTATRYYQALNSLIDRPQALAADPTLVNRLRRLRDARKAQRSTRRIPA